MEAKTARATVELTKNDEGTWLNVEIAGIVQPYLLRAVVAEPD